MAKNKRIDSSLHVIVLCNSNIYQMSTKIFESKKKMIFLKKHHWRIKRVHERHENEIEHSFLLFWKKKLFFYYEDLLLNAVNFTLKRLWAINHPMIDAKVLGKWSRKNSFAVISDLIILAYFFKYFEKTFKRFLRCL